MPCCNAAPYKRLQRILHHSCNYTTHATKQCTGLCRVFSFYLPCFAAAVCRVHPAIPHRPRHVGTYHSAAALPAHTRYQRHAGTLYNSAQPPHYNNVYKGVPLLWIYARRCNISQTMQARRGQQYRPGATAEGSARRLVIWHRVSDQGAPAGTFHPAGQSSNKGAAGGAEPLAALAASLFRAFAR